MSLSDDDSLLSSSDDDENNNATASRSLFGGTLVGVTDFTQQPHAVAETSTATPSTMSAFGGDDGGDGGSGSGTSRTTPSSPSSSDSSSSSSDEDDDDDADDFDNLRLQQESKLFAPYRTVGLVTNSVPFQLNAHGKDVFVTTCLGRSWQVLRADTLSTSIVSRRLRDNITALAVRRTLTWAAVGCDLVVFKRTRRLRRVRGAHAAPIDNLLLFGDQLLTLSSAGRCMKLWLAADVAAGPIGQISFAADFTPTCVAHPHTYLNKVVVGSQEGHLEVWNTRTRRCLFRSSPEVCNGAPVTCLAQSPALDVLGCGLADGRAVLYVLRWCRCPPIPAVCLL